MGQRHQLFVIAKINGQYRSLAAVHHQWLYGQIALRACHRLLQIFGDPHNRRLLEHEIASAEKLRDEDWKCPIDWDNTSPKFPFVTTCLVVGASLDLSTGASSNASPEPWNMEFDQGDNNDGVTILDISEPSMVRYCFVLFGGYFTEHEDGERSRHMTPLRGAEYLFVYYDKEKWTTIMQELANSLDEFPLISASSLNEAWPRSDWKSRTEPGLQPAVGDEPVTIDSGSTQRPLATIAMAKSIERILDEEDELLEFVEELPSFQPSLKDYLWKHPSVVTNRPFGFVTLQMAVKGGKVLDLHLFPDLSVDQIIQLVQDPADPEGSSMLDVLDLSGNTNITIEGIRDILNKRSVQKLYLWNIPQLTHTEVLPFIRAGRVKELLHPGLFAASFDAFERTSFRNTTPPVDVPIPISPFRQLAWIHSPRSGIVGKSSPDGPFNAETRASLKGSSLGWIHGLTLSLVPLHDTNLTPKGLLGSLAKLMQGLAMNGFCDFGFGSGGLIFPLGLAMPHLESWAVSPIPETPYVQARLKYHSSGERGWTKMHPLTDGEWTVLVFHDRSQNKGEGGRNTWADRYHVAFLTQHEGQKRVLGAKTFVEETTPSDFRAVWDKTISGLTSTVELGKEGQEEPRPAVEVTGCDEETIENLMALMEMFGRGEIG